VSHVARPFLRVDLMFVGIKGSPGRVGRGAVKDFRLRLGLS
jgi:hypothetical protein